VGGVLLVTTVDDTVFVSAIAEFIIEFRKKIIIAAIIVPIMKGFHIQFRVYPFLLLI